MELTVGRLEARCYADRLREASWTRTTLYGVLETTGGWGPMIRFLIGIGLGAALMYWYLTGEIPFRREVERLLSASASPYSASEYVVSAAGGVHGGGR